jgi:hypothetical protein
MTLLKNKGDLLPLDLTTITSLAIVGPYTFCTQNIKGDCKPAVFFLCTAEGP